RVSSASTISLPASRSPLLAKGSTLPSLEDCQRNRPTLASNTVFMITETGVHDPPDSAFIINRNGCSRSTGFSVHDPPERARAGLARRLLTAFHIERVMDVLQRSVPAPQAEIAVDRAARRQVLRDVAPLAAGAQHIHHAVDHLTHVDGAPAATSFGRRD